MKEEMVEVTIKLRVPKRLMQLIEEQNYFGWNKEDFFVSAMRNIVSAELSEKTPHALHRIYAKYGEDIDVIYPPRYY